MELRPYQRESIDAVYRWMEEHSGNPLVVLPTGTGKSIVIATFCQEALTAFPDTRILVLTHVKELILQNFLELRGLWPDAPAGVYSAGLNRRDMGARILFAGIQSIHSKIYELPRIDIVLVDEAHLIPRNSGTTYARFLKALAQINPYLKVVGLTATPYRMDSGLLHRGEGAIFSDIAYEYPILEAIKAGYLTRPVSKPAEVQIDTSQVGTRGGEFIPGQLEAAAIHPEVVASVADEIVRHGQDRRGWIVFGCGVEHCSLLSDALRERGVASAAIFGHTPGAERDRLIADFKAQRIRALVSMNVLTTGFNAKHVDLIAVPRPTKSVGLWIQIVGRGTRLFEGKSDFLVLDFGGNIERHGPIDKPKVKGEKKKKEKAEEPAAPSKICLGCSAPNPISARECQDCGAPFPPIVQTIATSASTMGLLSEDQMRPQMAPVTGVQYRRHQKPGKPPSMRVVYSCGLAQHSEWVAVEHTGYPRAKAEAWWAKRAPAGMPLPASVAEAMELAHNLRAPSQIAVRPNGKFTEIVGAIFT